MIEIYSEIIIIIIIIGGRGGGRHTTQVGLRSD